MVNAEDLQKKIAAGLPGATVIVEDPFNDGTHLTARVYSPAFQGLTKVAQHRAVYAVLGNAFAEDLHALQLTTGTPDQSLSQ